jgi:glycyl-tRNA synthetase beta chain
VVTRELLIEIGLEELPASWLPAATRALGDVLTAALADARLDAAGPVTTWSTPRRLAVRVGGVAERQADREELLTGPPVSAAFAADGSPTPAATGFARRNGVEVANLERIEVPEKKGTYLAVRVQHRGRAATDVLPEVLATALRAMPFPKQMRWDARLDDGRGELLFGRPIRWLVFLFGDEVVPFTILRSAQATGSLVQPVVAGRVTRGHRVHGASGASLVVHSVADYRSALARNGVVLDRDERRARIDAELTAEAARRGASIDAVRAGAALLQEVPDLIEYPVVVSGGFADEFLALPEEVLTTTMIHHQHFFPLQRNDGALMPAFLAVLNTEPASTDVVSRNLERVLTARLRDARFFWDADRARPLADRVDALDTVLFHKKLGTYREKAARVEALARWLCADVLQAPHLAAAAATAGRLCKVDLATSMVRELTELQGTMGGIYAREDGHPATVWKAIYHHYLPQGVEADAPPSAAVLGEAARTWAAVAMADKLDTLVGMFAVGERPTGSRDPHGLRRAAQGLVRTLVDLEALTGVGTAVTLGPLVAAAARPFAEGGAGDASGDPDLWRFLVERLRYVLEQRGYDVRNVRAVTHGHPAALAPAAALRRLEVLATVADSAEFRQLATLFKRVRNIVAKNAPEGMAALHAAGAPLESILTEEAERALWSQYQQCAPGIAEAAAGGDRLQEAFERCARLGPAVARFFDDVMVMCDDPTLRMARLRLVFSIEQLVLQLADVSEIVSQE